MITLPPCPDRAARKAASWSVYGNRSVITPEMSSPLSSSTDIAYQVSNISRP